MQIIQRNFRNLLLFGRSNSRLWRTKLAAPTRLDFNKHNPFSALNDEVNLTRTCAVVLCANFIPLRFEVLDGKGFADLSHLNSGLAHFIEVENCADG